MTDNSAHQNLKIPAQVKQQHSFFDLNVPAVTAWAKQLPRANMGEMAKNLFQALGELNQVSLAPATRVGILEVLRPHLYYVTDSLSKHFSNRPLILDQQAAKIAQLSESLFELLATGYVIAAAEACEKNKSKLLKKLDLPALAAYRGINELTQLLLHSYRLFKEPKVATWQRIHGLYQLAQNNKLASLAIKNVDDTTANISTMYKCSVLLACSKPNQLRQEDFSLLHKLLATWAERAHLLTQNDSDSQNALFQIDPSQDAGPCYRELAKPSEAAALFLDTRPLIGYLNRIKETNISSDGAKVSDQALSLSTDLLNHLILSWSTLSKRMFMRLESDDELELCIGLSATHFHTADQTEFHRLVNINEEQTFAMEDDNPFLRHRTEVHRQSKDVWDSAYSENVGKTNVALESIEYHLRKTAKDQAMEHSRQLEQNPKFEHHNIRMMNVSPGGYCLHWPDDVAAQIKTGEIVGIRETHHKNWNIGVVRWASQKDKKSLIGIELLSPNALAYGARIIQNKGAPGDFLRALILPEIKLIEQPATIVTPSVPFKTGQKVMIVQNGKQSSIQLTEELRSTPSMKQFAFRHVISSDKESLKKAADNSTSEKDSDFNSVWKTL